MDDKRKKNLRWQIPFLVLLIVGTVLIIRQQQNMPYQKCSGTIFGTVYNITYQYDKDLQQELVAKMQEVDDALSMFNEKSIISHINRNDDVAPNEMFLNVFNLAQQVADDTDGAFDITVAPLVNIWGFGFKRGQTPSRPAVDSLMQLIGHEKVTFDGKIVTRGINEKRLPWKIGVTKPTDEAMKGNGELQTVLNVTDKAMATSGNYRNFYYKGGRRYAHTIDPKTGYPVQHNILSATVLAERCAVADAYATSFMVMGLDKTKKILEKHPDLMAYIIYDDQGQNKIWYSPSLKDKIQE